MNSMRRQTLYLLLAAMALASCKDKIEPPKENITFSARDAVSTKAILDDSGLKTSGNRLHVCDLLTGFTGSVSWMSANNPYYINEEIEYSGSPVWDYTSGRVYPWPADGSHVFFGWLSYDSTMNLTASSFCGATLNTTAATENSPAIPYISINTLEMNTSTPQFDFMYSDAVLADSENHVAGTPVDLSLNHLFTALNLTINNTSGNTVLLKSVTLSGMKNKRSATITYNLAHPTVATANVTSTDVVLYTSSDPAGTEFVHVDQVKNLTSFLLMWPQTYAELNGAKLVVEYNIRDTHGVLSDDLTANVILDNQNIFKTNSTGMDAGVKYTFLLQFKKSTMDIYTSALPWEYEEFDWDYGDHSIAARSGMFKDGVLAFYRGTGENATEPTVDEWSAKTMRFTNRSDVFTGRFYIEAPTSGRWQVNPFPMSAAQYFVVEPTSGDIDVNTENGKAEFTVRANPDLNPAQTQTLYFDVAIYFNGEWHDANSEFNRKNIKLVLDAN